ncbi:MAG: hypothetical protein LUD02_01450 [Tannerellaceae bacterium]|nr:hypothetical protein [Tannerellaceae bacterium]
MKLSELYQYIEDHSLLNSDTLLELEKLIEEYPYFQIAHMLYLKNLSLLQDIRLEKELAKKSICIPDRKKLFVLLETELGPSFFQEKKNKNSSFALIDAFLSLNDEENTLFEGKDLLFTPSVSSDYIYWSLNNQHAEEVAKEERIQLQHRDLIDSFIEESEQGGVGKRIRTEKEDVNTKPTSLPISPEATLEDSFFTETLARIYIKQKRYEKALQIIKNLNLKYPEKNVYFADQIRFLEKLIINTKK